MRWLHIYLSLFWIIITFIISQTACQTIDENNKEIARKTEVLATQKSLIVSFLNKGLTAMAHKELRRLLIQHPEDPDFINLMGLTQLALENPRKAAVFFKKSLDLHPRTSVALNLSSAYIEAGWYKKAIKHLQGLKKSEMTKSYQYPERISHNIGLAAERLQNYSLAEKYYTFALSENPNYYLSLMRLGQLYEKKRRYTLAQQTFLKARAACPLCFDPINALAMNYIASGHHRSAYLAIKRYLGDEQITQQNKSKAKKLLVMVRKISQARKQKISKKATKNVAN